LQQILTLEEQSIRPEGFKKIDPALLPIRELIIGDILLRESKWEKIDVPVGGSEELMVQLTRYAFYDVVRNFYLTAWIKTLPRRDTPGSRGNLIQERLKDIYWSLATISHSTGNTTRTTEVTELFKTKAQKYWITFGKINSFNDTIISNEPGSASSRPSRRGSPSLALSPRLRLGGAGARRGGPLAAADRPTEEVGADRFNEEKVLDYLGTTLNKDLLSLDGNFHLQQIWANIGLAIDEMLVHKKASAQEYLLGALEHLYLARQLLSSKQSGVHQYLNSALEDIKLHLQRLSQ
jgi:hypothetical protein